MSTWLELLLVVSIIVCVFWLYPTVIVPRLGRTRLGRPWMADERIEGFAGFAFGAALISLVLGLFVLAVLFLGVGLVIFWVGRSRT